MLTAALSILLPSPHTPTPYAFMPRSNEQLTLHPHPHRTHRNFLLQLCDVRLVACELQLCLQRPCLGGRGG